jgi:2-polyprenyl-6-methoxyphenol hydroxylase-like FAD-dependent oxidoreductase
MKRLIKEIIPWDAAWVSPLTLDDPNGWLVGKVLPIVRRPVAKLPSGRLVTALGDAAMVVDPITGQGSGNGSKMAKNLVESIIAHGDRPFDAAFMTSTFDRYFARRGHFSSVFTRLLLEPISEPVKEALIAQYGTNGVERNGRQMLADAFHENFNDPTTLTETLLDLTRTRALIAKKTGMPWLMAMGRGGVAIGKEQIRQRLGLPPRHPVADIPTLPLDAS